MRNSGRFITPVLLILVTLSSFLYGDNNLLASKTGKSDLQLIKLHYDNSSGERGVTNFEYDENGIMQRSFWTLLDKSRYSRNYHTYDSSGNMVLKYREFSDGLTSTNTYTYDGKGNILTDVYQRSDGRQGKVFYRYDDQNRQIEADCRGLNGWFNGLIKYEYDSGNKPIKGFISRDGKPYGSIIYQYDEGGRLILEHWDLGGVWTQTFTLEYRPSRGHLKVSYPSSNVFVRNTGSYRLVRENYDYSGRSGGPSFFHYDDKGRLERKVFESSAGFKTETTFEYNTEGLLTTSRRIYSDGKTGIFTYEFDGNRRLVRRVFKRSDGLEGLEEYEYDRKGNLVKGRYENFDGWLTGDLTFESDQEGFLLKGRFAGEEFSADIDFDLDGSGNVVRIHWDFSPGEKRSQTYTFEYEEIRGRIQKEAGLAP